MCHFAWSCGIYLRSLKLGNKASQPRAYFSTCKTGIMVSVFAYFEFQVWKWTLMWMQSCSHSCVKVHWAFWSCHLLKAVCSSSMPPWDPIRRPTFWSSSAIRRCVTLGKALTLLEPQPLYQWNDWVEPGDLSVLGFSGLWYTSKKCHFLK